MKVNSIELFSGAGGLAKGLEYSGVNHAAFVEWNKNACNTLRHNYQANLVHEGDIRTFDFGIFDAIDLVAGGPPCQPFSLGGKHKGNMDERDMFPFAVKAIKELLPKAFVFENVKGLLRKSFAEYLNYIILQLTYPEITKKTKDWKTHLSELENIHTKGNHKGLKYNVIYRLVNSANYGVPQKRERVIIVGIRNDLNLSWNFPNETHSEDALLWSKYVSKEYWSNNNIIIPDIEKAKVSVVEKKLINKYGLFPPQLKPWKTVREALKNIPEPKHNPDFHPEHVFRDGAKIYPGHTGSDIDLPSKALKAGDHGVPGGENMIRYSDGSVRYYTVLEAKRIQTFPDNYPILGSWTEAMRQLGNAVPVQLAETITKSLIKTINTHNRVTRPT